MLKTKSLILKELEKKKEINMQIDKPKYKTLKLYENNIRPVTNQSDNLIVESISGERNTSALNTLQPNNHVPEQMSRSLQECMETHNNTLQLTASLQQQREHITEQVRKTQEVVKKVSQQNEQITESINQTTNQISQISTHAQTNLLTLLIGTGLIVGGGYLVYKFLLKKEENPSVGDVILNKITKFFKK